MPTTRIVMVFVGTLALAGYLSRTDVRDSVAPSAAPPNRSPVAPARSQTVSKQPSTSMQAPPPSQVSVRVDPVVEQAVRARVTAYWQVRSKSSLLGAYPFYEPSFRAKYSSEQFLETFQRLLRFRPKFQGIEHVRFTPDDRTAVVGVKLTTRPEVMMGKELTTVSDETWRLVDGKWWKQAEPLLPSF